ncbi:MAG TPA: CcdB family protein [Parvibaculum sp.]
MAQFDVYRNTNPGSRDAVPYFLVLQHDVIETRALRVVVPFVPLARAELPMHRLNPVFEIEGQKVILSMLEIAGVPPSLIGQDVVMSLDAHRDKIIAAVDFLVTGI